MTEVPDHLLQRSRERRAALGLGGDAGEGGESAAPAAASAPATTGGAPAPAAAAPVIFEEPPPPPPPAYVAEVERNRVPAWIMPVLVALPFWALLYFGAFGERDSAEAAPPDGAAVYASAGCAGCHGAAGEGGVGPALTGGESKLTFPDEADHISWVRTGSGPFRNQPYGDPDREGGQRVATGNMPGFPTLSEAEVQAVVEYEREQL